VSLRAKRIHFLQASAWGAADGDKVGKYIVRYADSQRRSIPLLYQRSLIDWWVKSATDKPRSPGRGPPYWKSRVLRRQVLGDEDDGARRGHRAGEEVA